MNSKSNLTTFILSFLLLYSMSFFSFSEESSTSQTLELNQTDAILISLERNKNLQVQRFSPKMSEMSIMSAKGTFDPRFSVSGSIGEDRTQTTNPPSNDDVILSKSRSGSISIDGDLYTGTSYSARTNASRSESDGNEQRYGANYQFQITQSLLNGFGLDVNLARIRLAENNYDVSKSVFRNALINQITNVKSTYWDLYLAKETVRIRKEALKVAEEQTALTKELVRLGKVAEIELLSSQAEESARYSSLIDAESSLQKTNLQFLRLLSPEESPYLWDKTIVTKDEPALINESIKVAEHSEIAKKFRPDLEQAKIDFKNGELEIIQTRNGLLPRLDWFVSYGSRGTESDFDDSYGTASEFKYRNWSTGFDFSIPMFNRQARALYKRSMFSQAQAEIAIKNLEEEIELEVRTGLIEIERTKQQIETTKITRKLSEETLRAEKEKFRVGRSTNLLVSQAQRDLIRAEIDEVNSIISNIKAYNDFYRIEGTTLERNGIDINKFE